MNLLASLADRQGKVSLRRVERELGPVARRIVERSQRILVNDRTLAGESFRNLLVNLDPAAVRPLVDQLKPRQPMTVFARRARRGGPLTHARLLLANAHLLVDTEQLFEVLRHPQLQIAAWSKPQSTDCLVAASLHLKGDRVRCIPVGNDTAAVLAETRALLRSISHPERFRLPLLVLFDDGGELIRTVAELVRREFPRHAHLVAAAENTTRGIGRLLTTQLPFLVVDIARSWAKTIYGSPMLGYSVYRQTTLQLDGLAKQGIAPLKKKLVIIGAGPMGLAIARSYRQHTDYEILIHDRDPKARQKARVAGFAVERSKKKALAEGYLVVSAAGGPTITNRSLHLLPDGAVLVNAASLGEFPIHPTRSVRRVLTGRRRNHLLAEFQGRRVDLGDVADKGNLVGGPIHMVWEVAGGKRVLMVKGGMVVNFPVGFSEDRSRPIPGRYIQLPIDLMYQGIKQAAEGGPPGIRPLRMGPQRDSVAAVERALARRPHGVGQEPESLLSPRW